jgi:hypothetical protein
MDGLPIREIELSMQIGAESKKINKQIKHLQIAQNFNCTKSLSNKVRSWRAKLATNYTVCWISPARELTRLLMANIFLEETR